jgi:acetate kinase
MKILVANLGSTSFKYRLYDMAGAEKLLARGAIERIGTPASRCVVETGNARHEIEQAIPDHAAAVRLCLEQLSDRKLGALQNASDLSAIGFKAVHAQGITGVQRVDDRVLDAMEAYADVTPAHNPPYVRAMRLLARQFPRLPLVAAFETGFHESIPAAHRMYAVPHEWTEKHGIKRWGFHGASHRYVAEHTTVLLKNARARIISCHLGGSSSLCAIRAGRSVATSMGMSPQTGLPQNNRIGDFDVFAVPALMRATGKSLEQLLEDLATRSGLAGLSGVGNDLRDIAHAANAGNERARLAVEVYVAAIRHYLGAYLVQLGGADAIVFTGGIGERSASIRDAVCANLDWFGIVLDPALNKDANGEMRIEAIGSRVQVWVMPTDEEIIVARQVRDCLAASPKATADI